MNKLDEIKYVREKRQEYKKRIDEVRYFVLIRGVSPKNGKEYTDKDWREIDKQLAYEIIEDRREDTPEYYVFTMLIGSSPDELFFTWPFKGHLRVHLNDF